MGGCWLISLACRQNWTRYRLGRSVSTLASAVSITFSPDNKSAQQALSRHTVSINTWCLHQVNLYCSRVPKLWDDTIEAHREAVREATLETTAALVAQHGLASVTMAQIARETGIGRATLYKYFPDVDSILAAWHERHVVSHLAHLGQICDQAATPSERLVGVLNAYAFIVRNRPGGTEIAAVVHQGDRLARGQQHLSDLIRDVLAEAIGSGYIRGDTPPAELAAYCLHALAAAADLPSDAAVHRLVALTLGGLRAPGRVREGR